MTLLGGNLSTVNSLICSHYLIAILNLLASLYVMSHLNLQFQKSISSYTKLSTQLILHFGSLPVSSQIFLSFIDWKEISMVLRAQIQISLVLILFFFFCPYVYSVCGMDHLLHEWFTNTGVFYTVIPQCP